MKLRQPMPSAGQDQSPTGQRRVFHLLDAIRGLAALVVVQRHSAWLMGSEAWASTYLAVDLFFVLSGFVIAYSYEARLADGMSWRRFMGLRIIRLYPLYAVGLALGVAVLVRDQLHSPSHAIDWKVLAEALFSAALLLPNWGLPAIVGPRWSLTYELVANAGYAALVHRLSLPILWGFVAISGVALILIVAQTGTIDSGWEFWQAPVALARVSFSFGCGVLLYRIHDGQVTPWWTTASCALGVGLTLLAFTSNSGGAISIELLLIFIIFPALAITAASVDVHGRWIALCGILGTTSYALYVVHQPAVLLYEAALKRLFGAHIVPWAGWSALVVLMLTAWLLDRLYDTPVRRWLIARFG